jgi:allantoinase
MRTRFVNLRIPVEGNTRIPAEIIVADGAIESVQPEGTLTAAGDESWIDLAGATVLPGVIDGHVHFDTPGFTHRETFAHGTRAAAAGGVTCVVDMPCTSLPAVTTADALSAKLAAIDAEAVVDYALWGGVSGADVTADGQWRTDLAALAERGIAAIKVYTLSGMETFTDLRAEQLYEVLQLAAELGVPVGVHAEDRELVHTRTERLQAAGADGPEAYAASRPATAEVAAVAMIREVCRATGARTHVVHVASGDALDLIVAGRRQGLPISAETCPHFLQFTIDDLVRLGSPLKTAPVVKSAEDRQRLWAGLANGDIAFVATDHAAGQWPEEKSTGSFWTDYGGVPGVELLLPYMYSEGVCMGRLTLERLVQLTSREPALLFGLERKGRLQAGCDADFVVFDERETWPVDPEQLHSLNRYTPLAGHTMTGRVRATYLRGQCVYRRELDGTEWFADEGTGQWVRRGTGVTPATSD